MGRYLAIHFPYWAIDLQRRKLRMSSSTPVNAVLGKQVPALLLHEEQGQHVLLRRICEHGWRSGLRPEMPLAFARMLLTQEPQCYAYDALGDFQALLKVVQWCARLSPVVGVDSALVQHYRAGSLAQASVLDQGLMVDLRGTERLHHGFEKLLSDLQQRFVRSGIRVLMACAPTVAGAWALSRFAAGSYAQAAHTAAASAGQYFIVREIANLKRVLLPLPVESLRLAPQVVTQLQALGVVTLEQLLALPRRSLGPRYGIELPQRLDQLFGALPEALRVPRQTLSFRAQQHFETPLEKQETLAQATCLLLDQLLARLQQAQREASSFVLQWVYRAADYSQQLVQKEISLQHASAQRSHIQSIILPLLEPTSAAFQQAGASAREASERMQLPSGSNGVESIAVIARCTRRSESEQYVFEEICDSPAQKPDTCESSNARKVDQLFNVLTTRLGKNALRCIQHYAAHLPEKSFGYEVIQRMVADAPRTECMARPSRLFSTPEPVEAIALLPDKPPAAFIWRGQRLRVLQGIGPERIRSEWWQLHGEQYAQVEERDYFSVLDQSGRWVWLYRENCKEACKGRWFAHGIWE
jgi:protein ImuB